MSVESETEFLPVLESKRAETAWSAIGWLLFVILLLCSPAVVWAAWGWLL